MADETLKEKTTRGLFWGGMNNVVQQGNLVGKKTLTVVPSLLIMFVA